MLPDSARLQEEDAEYVNKTGAPWTASQWAVMNSVLELEVKGEGRTHSVVVLPNGTARLGL